MLVEYHKLIKSGELHRGGDEAVVIVGAPVMDPKQYGAGVGYFWLGNQKRANLTLSQ
jgi:hypothetical protein